MNSFRRKLHRRIIGSALLPVLSFVWCALPLGAMAGDGSVIMSRAREEEIGREASVQVEQSMGLVRDPALEAYVDTIGQRLAALSPRQDVTYRFHIVNMSEPNAFALPGGYIYVSRGLLALTSSEEELVNVIAHEIAHISARHSAERELQEKTARVLSILGLVAGLVAGDTGAAAAASMFGQSWLSSYNREQEREADRLGQSMSMRAGWDPTGMADFLRKLENWTRLETGTSRFAGYFDTHPSTPERVAKAATRARSLLGHGKRPRREITPTEYIEHLDGLMVEDNPEEGVFQKTRFLHVDMDFTLRFPRGWELRNTPMAVGAIAPGSRQAMITLETPTKGDDPKATARKTAKDEGLIFFEEGPMMVGKFPAYHAVWEDHMGGDKVVADAVWIAYNGMIWRITGVASGGTYRSVKNSFKSTTRSFRPLTEAEKESVQAVRLRVAQATEGESLKELGQRTSNVWTVHETAVRNGFFADVVLEDGQSMKVAVAENYIPMAKKEAKKEKLSPEE